MVLEGNVGLAATGLLSTLQGLANGICSTIAACGNHTIITSHFLQYQLETIVEGCVQYTVFSQKHIKKKQKGNLIKTVSEEALGCCVIT